MPNLKVSAAVCLVFIWVLFSSCVGCAREESVDSEAIEKTIRDYVSDCYSKYYLVEDINASAVSVTTNKNKVEARVYVNIKTTLKAETVEDLDFVKGMNQRFAELSKEEQERLSDTVNRKKEDLQTYIGNSSEGNFVFIFTSSVKNGVVDVDDYQLLFETDNVGNDKYIPADLIMPGEGSAYEKEGYDFLDSLTDSSVTYSPSGIFALEPVI